MPKLTKEDVLKLAKLSRLHIKDDEISELHTDIDAILKFVEEIQSVNLSNYEPTSQVTGLENVMRSDEAIDYGVSPDELLKNVPNKEKGYIKVRRVLE